MSANNLLYQKLSQRDFPKERNGLQNFFAEIADLLMNHYAIKKGVVEYEIIEIEFYLFTPDHPDFIAYPRLCEAGKWFFHQSGVDLTFHSTADQFGGILIRGIKRMTPRVDGDNRPSLILGPQKCVDELWDIFNAFSVNAFDYPVIVPANVPNDANIKYYPRWIPLNRKTIEEVEDAKSRRVEAAITKNLKYINGDSLRGFCDCIDKEVASDIMFNGEYRFLKYASIDKESSDWKKYNSKP